MNLPQLRKFNNSSIEVKASVAYTVCSVMQKGLSFITLPLFTRLLTTEQYGQYTVYQSWSSILTIFITMNLAYGTFQTAMVRFKGRRDEYSSSISMLFAVLGTLFLIIYLPFQQYWNKLFELPTLVIVLMVIEIIGNGVTDCWLSKNRFEYKYKSVILMTFGKALISPLLAFLLVISFEEKGYARIAGYALANICVGVIVYFLILKKEKTFYCKEFWKYALSFNIPLIPYYVSQMIFNASDRIMISHMVGTDQAAIYGVAYSLAMVLNFVINAVNSSYSPWFFLQLEKKAGEKNQKVSFNLSLVVALGLWLIIAIAPEFITIMAGSKYSAGVWAVPPVAISVLLLFYTQLFDRVLFFYEKKYLLVFGGIIPCLVNLALNYLLIPIYGFVAAAYTTLISYILFAIINYYTSKRALKENNNNHSLYNIKGLIAVFLVLVILSILMMLLYDYVLVRIIIVVFVVIVMWIKREVILSMIKMETNS